MQVPYDGEPPVARPYQYYGPRGTSQTVTQPSRPSLPTSIAGSLQHEAIAGQAPSLLVAVSKPIENPNPMTGMILAPNRNNQIRAIRSAGFNASLQLPFDQNRVQFCMSYHLRGHCNDNCMRVLSKRWTVSRKKEGVKTNSRLRKRDERGQHFRAIVFRK